jgi:NAD(P)-dependent dehydrogenase (short-subunit alcohol dehydrogenase family)
MTNPLDLTGKRILITGASSGIGRETAFLLSSLGAQLVICGRNEERLRQTYERLTGAGHRTAAFDLSGLDAIPAWVKGLAAEGGPFAGLVHSAGTFGMRSAIPLRMLAAEDFEAVSRVNVGAAAMLAKGIRQKGCCVPASSVVFLSSVLGVAGKPGIAAYSASKAALLGLTRSLAVELAREGIRVNSIVPGVVKTEMADSFFGALSPEQAAAVESAHPLGLGAPLDIAHSIAFLLSGAARWITGSALVVDGGYTAH